MHNDISPKPTAENVPRAQSESSEAEFLSCEVALAKAELENALAGLKSGLASSADLRAWVKRYPWAAIGTAAVAGFAAGTAITPAPGESPQARLSGADTNGQSNSPTPAPEPTNAPHAATQSMGSVVSEKLLTALFDLAKFAIQSVIQAALHPPALSQGDYASTADPWQTRVAK